MKYIRAEDRIYKVVEEYKDEGFFNIKINHLPNKLSVYYREENYTYTPADTIEELCDAFVSVSEKYHDLWSNFEEPKLICSESDIYGAVWTDRGLIYVAKMNDKGELELL